MEPTHERVMEPPPAPGTHYFDYLRFVLASSTAVQRLRDLITGFKNWEPCSPYVIGMILRDAAEVEHGIPGSDEEIIHHSPVLAPKTYHLYHGESPQMATVAHNILWEEHRRLIERLRSHCHLLGAAPDGPPTVHAPQTFDKHALRRIAEQREVACRPFDPEKWQEFRAAMMQGITPDEREFESLFLQAGDERARVMREYDQRIKRGTHSLGPIDGSVEATTASDPSVQLNPPQITIDGRAYALTPNQAIYLDELLKVFDWMSDPVFKERRQNEVGGSARPDKWRKGLPPAVLSRIETHQSRGSRWKR